MKFRYFISSGWNIMECSETMRSIEFAAAWYKLDTGICSIKLLSNNNPDSGDFLRIKNNKFEIRVNKKNLSTLDDIRKTIFHEMTHVKQCVKDGLRLEGKNSKFRGTNYDTNNLDYWIRPWEIEARGMEEALLAFYKTEYE